MATSHYTSPAQTRMGGASSAATSGSSMVTYPAYTPTNYYSAYNKQNNQKVCHSRTWMRFSFNDRLTSLRILFVTDSKEMISVAIFLHLISYLN